MSPDELKRKLEFFIKIPHTAFLVPIRFGVFTVSVHQKIVIAGLVASALAYGRAEIIIRNCEWVFEKPVCK